jgi:hypothetical protein
MAMANAVEGTGIGLVELSARAEASTNGHNEKLSSLAQLEKLECEILARMNFSGSLSSVERCSPLRRTLQLHYIDSLIKPHTAHRCDRDTSLTHDAFTGLDPSPKKPLPLPVHRNGVPLPREVAQPLSQRLPRQRPSTGPRTIPTSV